MEKQIILTPKQINTFIPITFDVPRDTQELRFLFSYDPHYCPEDAYTMAIIQERLDAYDSRFTNQNAFPPSVVEAWEYYRTRPEEFQPLRNQLKFSLYGPQGEFLGRWDSPQYFGKWVTIGPVSSRGFLGHFLPSGEWTLEIECHGIFSPEVTVSLEIKTVPSQRAKRWFSGELHAHTNHSDGNCSLDTLMEAAYNSGLDFLVLTDHNTTSAWNDIDNQFPVKVIPGIELSSYFGHVVVSGITEYVDWRAYDRNDPLENAFSHAAAQGAITTIAHPFEPGGPLCCGCEWEFTNVDLTHLDALEIWSGTWKGLNGLINWRALAWWDELLNQGQRITGVAARDAHNPNPFFNPHTANTYVQASSSATEEILEGIRLGRVFVSSGPELELSILGQGQLFTIGDTAPLALGEILDLAIALTKVNEPLVCQVVVDGEVVHTEPVVPGEYRLTLQISRPKGWVRVQFLREGTTEFVTISNPIFVEKA